MTSNSSEPMDLASLESRVDELIRTIERLASENQALRTQRAQLTAERAALIEKTELARARVESKISRLKAMEMRS
jgi:cell division protein ZapB